MPVFIQDTRHPALFDGMMGDVFRPFWERGHGRILCPVCLFTEEDDGTAHPSFWSRLNFISHWEQQHYSSYVVSSTFSATQLHTRVYMGHLLYTLALGCRKMGEDNPLRLAVNMWAFTQYKIKTSSTTLATLYPPSQEEACLEVEEVATVTEDESGVFREKASEFVPSMRELLDGARVILNAFLQQRDECSFVLHSLEEMMGEEIVKKMCGEEAAGEAAGLPVSTGAAPLPEDAARPGAARPEEKLPGAAAGHPASSEAAPMEVDAAEGPDKYLVSQEDVVAALTDSVEEEDPFVLVKARHKKGNKKK